MHGNYLRCILFKLIILNGAKLMHVIEIYCNAFITENCMLIVY